MNTTIRFTYRKSHCDRAGIVDLNPERRWLVSAQLASLSHRFAQKTAHFRRVLLGKSRQL
jgi:hypothetical protein